MKSLARERDKAEILRRLRTVRPDSLRRWGRMSAPQMICHLIDATRMALGNKLVTSVSSLAQRTVIKAIALYAPLPWPAGIPTSPEVDQEIGGTVPTSFAADVAELEALVALMASRRDATWPLHPIFGRMSEAAWHRWAYLHMDHHLRQFGH